MEYLYARGKWHFIEMNMRMQVEHPVTECETGYDLVKTHLLVSMGHNITLPAPSNLHAIECRINLKSFNQGALIKTLRLPGGYNVRVDAALYAGYSVSHHYDAMLAKIICYDHDRAGAIKRMQVALSEVVIGGIDSNVEDLKTILAHPSFQDGSHHTQLLS
jgi:acetyl-CoA carboxylase biotin carboxylase subunit